MDAAFPMLVVYENPSDYPGRWVVRQHNISANGSTPEPGEPFAVAVSLDEARLAIRTAHPYMLRMHRLPDDEPQIFETWF